MKVGMVALHYPRREHRDEMILRVRQAADVMMATPGCLAADCWVSEDGQAVVTTGQWESEQALTAGVRRRANGRGGLRLRRARVPARQVFKLVSA